VKKVHIEQNGHFQFHYAF